MTLENPNEYEKGKTIVYFVRHGDKLDKDVEHRAPGLGLSHKGIQQAKDVAKKFSKISNEVDALYSSSMLRALETAEEIRKVVDKKIAVCEDLCEFNRAIWETRIYHPKFWKYYKRYLAAHRCFKQILKDNRGKVIIIVAHGNVIKGIIGKHIGVSFKNRGLMRYDNCYITKVRYNNTKFDYLDHYNSKDID